MNNPPDIKQYLDEVQSQLATKQAREHTYRPAQVALFDSFENIKTANDQARTKHGSTDYVFRNRTNEDIVLGYGEAKDINVDLDKIEKTEQLERYGGYNNLILTNYIEFRFFKNGKRYAQVEIAKLDKNNFSISPIPENYNYLLEEINAFFTQPPEVIKSAKRLSEIMGAKARRIRMNIEILLNANAENANTATEIAKVYGLMRELLVHDLEQDKFADMYAQTLVYGLFAARYNDHSPENFSREEARDLIPTSNPFLREFFDHIAGPRFEKGLAIIVDELCQVFQVSDVSGIIDKYLDLDHEDKKDSKDPIIHFYEDFLNEYDAKERKKMGAYYTPTPVVRYMVRAVDRALKEHFGIEKGLADSSKETIKVSLQGKKVEQTYHKVQVLDPATGTGTFLNEIIKFVHSGFEGQEGLWPAYARDDLIPRLHGFELMMGAYTIAHLKLGLTLQSLGVNDFGKRLGVYLTNSLEEGIAQQPDLFSFGLAEAVTSESHEAAHIKSERPIMVVIGNPPYSVSSSNKGNFIQDLIKVYKKDLNERKINLDDDYIKFLRLAESLIEKNGQGIVAMITNNSFIDGLTHRQMRKHLSETFDEIYIIDLHGNSKKKETSPDGSKDENVFDIQQGVSINIFIKTGKRNATMANVYHSELYGLRAFKFSRLNLESEDLNKFSKVDCATPNYFFIPKSYDGAQEYESGFDINEMFTSTCSGFRSGADAIQICWSEAGIRKVVEDLIILDEEKFRETYKHHKDGRNHNYVGMKKDVGSAINEDRIIKTLYRPFDERWTYYSYKSSGFVARPRHQVMKNFVLKSNLGLIFKRGYIEEKAPPVGITNLVSGERTWTRPGMQGADTVAPLWLYDEQGNKSSNLNPSIVSDIKKAVPKADELGIFDYIYGVLHWPEYREKYKEFLKTDFPRVPYPKGEKEFERFRSVGEKLRGLHLMKDKSLSSLITTYPEAGSNIVEKISYSGNRVFINSDQYFGEVPLEAWEFYIGGYQPAQKWLKDRKGRELSPDDIMHYQKIIKVLFETHKIMSSM